MNTGWPTKPLGDVAPAQPADFPSGDEVVWNLSLEDIESGSGRILREVNVRVAELGSTKTAFDKRHVLYSKLRPYLNKVVVPSNPGVGTSELIPLCPIPELLGREFLAFHLRSPVFLEFATQHMQGANLPRVAMKEFWAYPVPLPAFNEQCRIVGRIKECLSRIDEVKWLRSEALHDAEAIFPSVLSTIFNDLRNKYHTTIINDIVLETRYGISQKCHTNADGTPILRIPNIINGAVNNDDLKYCNLSMKEREKLLLQDGDILVVRTNGSPDLVGRCAVVTLNSGEEFGFASYLIRIRVDRKKVHPRFLAYFLTSTHGRTAIENIRRTAAGQYNINSENIRAITLPLPSLAIQNDLAGHMDTQYVITKHLYKEQIDLAMNESYLVQSILSKAFAGEL